MALPVNSRAWWDDYFEHQWRESGGREQTRHFMEALTAHLGPAEFAFLSRPGVRILDWGCALGEGVRVLSELFPNAVAEGLDFSAKAVEGARQQNPGLVFHHTDGSISGEYDVIVTSNCLEHFDKPFDLVRRHLARCRMLYLLLVPLEEKPLHHTHRARFTLDSFPSEVGDFTFLGAIPVAVDPLVWNGAQVLAAYGSPSYTAQRSSIAPSTGLELQRLRHANAVKDVLLGRFRDLLADRDRGIAWLRSELENATKTR
jgi:SAM-dependent methyltransferase